MFKVIIPKIVFKELEKIDNTDRQLVFEKLKDLENGHFENDKSLQGKHKGKFRKRAGNYRIIYLKENDILLITLVRIAHRKEVYFEIRRISEFIFLHILLFRGEMELIHIL